MRGHIRRRSKRSFTVWIELPRVNGKRKREVLTVIGTQKQAEAKMSERIAAIEGGDYSRAGKMTVTECLNRWLSSRESSIGRETLARYKSITNDYLIPSFGSVPLKKLTPLHVEDALAAWRTAKRKDRKAGKLSQRTVHHIFSTLKNALKQAVRWNLITRNPCDAVTPPSIGHADVQALDEARAAALIRALENTPLAVPVFLTILTGLRRGELLGLKWDDIDFENRWLYVRRALEQLENGCAFKEPKTKKSRRHIALHADALEALRKHKAQQNGVRLALGGEYNAEGLVFPDPLTGEAWVPDRFSSAFYYQAHKAEINVSFHGLRHSFATIAQRAGASLKDTSDSLGHSAIGITADMYSHVFDDSRRGVAERVGEAIAGEMSRFSA